jgi:hypothetical protein
MAILADEILPKINTGRTSGEIETVSETGAPVMKPPIFSITQTGSIAQQYLHRAQMFREAAVQLPDYSNGEQFWPKCALLTHAIELSLKAFAQYSVENGKALVKEPKQHDLLGWYHSALIYGLQEEPYMERNIELLNQLHLTHYMRYPHNRTNPIPDASNIVDDTVDRLILAFTQSINPR